MLHLHLQARDEEDEEDDGGRSDTSPPRGLDVWMEGKLSTPSRTNASLYIHHTNTFIYLYKHNLVVNDATKLKKQDFRSS